MSYVFTTPEALTAAAGDLAGIRQAISEAATAVAPPTTGIVAAAADEVSVAIATLFGGFGKEFRALSTQTTVVHAQLEAALRAAAAAYAAAEAANVSPLGSLLVQLDNLGLFAPVELLIGRQLFGGAGPGFVPARTATLGALLNSATDAVGLGRSVNFPSTVALAGPDGVTGVRLGFSFLQIPISSANFFGIPLPTFNYPAPALWYFPTGSAVPTVGTTYLQHGFGAIGWLYQPLAMELATQTNSVVVTPTIPFIPLPAGVWLGGPEMQRGVGSLFLGSQPALNTSAHQAGYLGTLPQDFVLTGHSAGGGLAALAAGNYVTALGAGVNHLQGVVMFDGVAGNATAFGAAVANLQAAQVPIYTVAAPPQSWNADGATTIQLASLYPGQFSGVTIVGGSHVDSMLGDGPLIDLVLQAVTQFSPPGATEAVYTLATGWINDMYTPGAGPSNPIHGIYGPTGPYVAPGGQTIILGPATGIVLP